MKQETIEEATKRLYPNSDDMHLKREFISDAKWQAERMYSEEKVDKLLDTLFNNNMCSVAGDELIEQFKNK